MKKTMRALSLILALTMAFSLTLPAMATFERHPDFGDINCDRKVNFIDVILVFFKQIGFYNPNENGFKNADVNADGVINGTDRAIIKQYIKKQITEWPLLADPVVEEILIAYPPDRTKFAVGEAFDPTGMCVVANCKGYVDIEVPIEDCEITGYSNTFIGKKTLTVTYEGKSVSFDVEVVVETIEKYECHYPTKSFYTFGSDETLSTDGAYYYMVYNTGRKEALIEGITYKGFTTSSTGTTRINVFYNTVCIGGFYIVVTNPEVIGDSVQSVKSYYGEPDRIDQSEFGFEWFVYNSNYSKFKMIGIKDGYAVALYFLNDAFDVFDVTSGMSVNEFTTDFPEANLSISEINPYYEMTVNTNDKQVVCNVFFDKHDSNKCYAVLAYEKSFNVSWPNYPYTEAMMTVFETEIADMTNAFRAIHSLPVLSYSTQAAAAAKDHSIEMRETGNFSHIGSDGSTPGTRMTAKGIVWENAAENIAYGLRNPVFAINGWINSEGHRQILVNSDITHIGVGAVFNGSSAPETSRNLIYYTQNFYKPQ